MTPATDETPTPQGPRAFIGNLFIGLALVAAGAVPLYFDLRKGSTLNFPSWLVAAFAACVVGGLLAIRPDPIIGGAKRASSIAVVIIKAVRGQSTTVTVAPDPPTSPPNPPAGGVQ